jgi:hypothetical protein
MTSTKTRVSNFESYNTYYGTVIGRSISGVYITLEDGRAAFAYNFTTLPFGTRVLCSVKSQGERNLCVKIESSAFDLEIA